ncbi:MAG: hypothetical protein FJW34_02965, partial [Acidobacteria bacterium]|nr:hypothetical protein [Acidobacteriota bacterium]
GRVGRWAHLTRQRGIRASQELNRLAAAGARRSARATAAAARQFREWILLQVGWLTPPRAKLEAVTLRPHLGGALPVESRTRELPMIYQRLFRLAPVEDPRFLVGREEELMGLAAAAAQWRAGRAASVLVVGARGSGKTSLLNCAVAGILAQAPIVRGQFSGRMTTAEQLHRFLRELFGVTGQGELMAALTEPPRVVIVEELERTFLRVVNGFGALRELLDLICATSVSTLWVLSINETAFRYLDAVLELSRCFSHRITAMFVERQDLTNAILQRHNLSGLRLEFTPVPRKEPRLRLLRRGLGLEQDLQELFFEALFRHSEGIFRSAFERWKACIESVEGGAVRMRQPLAPNYEPLRRELGQQDGFLLQAVIQHGGLTVEEVARVLDLSQTEARRAVDRLQALEILEPEPDGLGLRVQPEAGLFVRDFLHRQNLW